MCLHARSNEASLWMCSLLAVPTAIAGDVFVESDQHLADEHRARHEGKTNVAQRDLLRGVFRHGAGIHLRQSRHARPAVQHACQGETLIFRRWNGAIPV